MNWPLTLEDIETTYSFMMNEVVDCSQIYHKRTPVTDEKQSIVFYPYTYLTAGDQRQYSTFGFVE